MLEQTYFFDALRRILPTIEAKNVKCSKNGKNRTLYLKITLGSAKKATFGSFKPPFDAYFQEE